MLSNTFYTSTVTQKGQVTIPIDLRNELGLKMYSKVIFKKAADHVKIYPTQDIVDMAGMFKVKGRKLSAVKAREYMEKHYSRV